MLKNKDKQNTKTLFRIVSPQFELLMNYFLSYLTNLKQ